MKRIALLIAFVSVVCAATSQTPAYDTTFRPNNYALKVEQFKSYPHSTSDIVFLGNSITANVEWRELLDMPNIKNRGISGDISFGVLERLDEVINGKPAKVFVLIGINDISRNIPDEMIVANYRKIISRIRQGSPETKIYFHTLLPVNNEFTQFKNHYNKDEHIAFLNSSLQAIAKETNITLIDLHPILMDANGKLDKKYTIDGLHINAEGYKKWAAVLKGSGVLK
ncbi:sialate O-acetylesterase [Sediminibacterium roseum]|uniref:Sialate O-acetylesterase n=1 Tax=Sediminibacterium roseum TaxID=1978412 RepID=A0ABW9ZQA0_9BACT|nr:GDSL-type esterase/lipase family protein [Sediminibacterium roseum]NCI48439.1 sialate O-acetylesterase [Sediminibacterium roseum]